VASQDQVAKFSGLRGDRLIRIVVGASSKHEGWLPYEQTAQFSETFKPDGATAADDPMLLYFTSGTTAKPKLVRTASAAIRSAHCRRCTGWGCGPATFI